MKAIIASSVSLFTLLVLARLAALWQAGQDLPVLMCAGMIVDFVVLALIAWASSKHPSW